MRDARDALTDSVPAPVPPATPASPPAASAPATPLSILIVDDNPVQRRMSARTLVNMGYAVDAVTNGDEAIAKIFESTVDVLITDWEMPGMDGPALCAAVRNANLDRYMYIIMVTSHDSVRHLVAGIGAGADVFLTKPVNSLELHAHLIAGRRIIQLERELRAAKATDSLLGIYTRDYLDAQLPREILRARRYAYPLTLVMADLDRFKRVNDEHGHGVGDQVLKCFCDRARASIRETSDWIARYGGEEFAIVLPQTSLTGGFSVAEKLRVAFIEEPICVSVGMLTVTVSMGVAGLLSDGDADFSAAQLLQRADTALYRSKKDGRNRVTGWAPD